VTKENYALEWDKEKIRAQKKEEIKTRSIAWGQNPSGSFSS